MLRITISNERQRKQVKHGDGPFELGRGPKKELDRFIIEDRFVSRDQLRLGEMEGNRISLHNLGGPATLADGSTMDKGESKESSLPVRLTIGYTMVEITSDDPDDSQAGQLQTISRPVQSLATLERQESINSLGETPPPEKLAEWFETLLTVQRAAAGSDEFYGETARAVVDLVGLDSGSVILRKGNSWEIAAKHSTRENKGHDFSTRVLNQVLEQQRTYYQGFDENIDTPVTLFELDSNGADERWLTLCQRYEEALAVCEAGNFDDAAGILRSLLQDATYQDARFRAGYDEIVTAWQAGDVAGVPKMIQRLVRKPGFRGEAPALILAYHAAKSQQGQTTNLCPVFELDTK